MDTPILHVMLKKNKNMSLNLLFIDFLSLNENLFRIVRAFILDILEKYLKHVFLYIMFTLP